jgi:seryl-tRNA synthetase
MIDVKLLRENPELVRTCYDNRNSPVDLDAIRNLDQQRREILHELEKMRAEQNRAGQQIAEQKKARADASAAIAAMKTVSAKVKQGEEEVRKIEDALNTALLELPNILDASVPVGPDENANRIERTWGEPPHFNFAPKDHVDIGESLGILDFQAAAKLSGARFVLLRGAGSQLARGLTQFMLDTHTRVHGYTEILPPFLVSAETMRGSGQLPKFAEEAFAVKERDLWLVPTAEVPLTNMHRDEILPAEDLPLKYTAYTPCFRSEAGSYGKDTRGMLRQHQFDKVELYKFTTADTSWDELESLTRDAAAILEKLELPYRVVTLSTGDTGFSAAKTYDLEVWLPGQGTYREISSCSNCTDFQARRANIRVRTNKKPEFVHTLNGSGLAVGRTLIALLENYQQADGSVVIPEVLRPYMAGCEVLEPRS